MGEDGSFNLEIELVDDRSLNLPALQRHFERPAQSHHPRLLALAHQIHSELQVHDTAQAIVLEGLSLEFFGIASRLVDGGEPRSIQPNWLTRVREIMHDRFQDSLRIAELAALGGVHPVYLARIFRVHYGMTPGLYLRHLRLEWAVQQLDDSNRSLSDIAISAGFSDQSHFTRAFKQHFGASPGRLRRLRTT